MWIEFNTFDRKILILLIFPLFSLLENLNTNLYIKEDNSLFIAFRYFISYIFGGIFSFIKYKKANQIFASQFTYENQNGIQDRNKDRISQLELIRQERKKKKKIKNSIFLLALSIIALFCLTYGYIFKYESKSIALTKQILEIFFYMVFYIILSYFILKQPLYRHHYASMVIMGLILLILFILTIKYIDENNKLYITIFYFLGYAFIFSLYDVLGKKYMNVSYNSPYFVMFIIGTINSILLLIFDIFAYYLRRHISGIIIGFKKNINHALDFFIFLFSLLLEFIWNLGIWLIIYYFTPCHFFISNYIYEYIYYIKNTIESNDDIYSPINIIIFSLAYLINFFCCLVFNEVIILNFCKLDYNTKKRIEERMKVDNNLGDYDDESYHKQRTDYSEDEYV